MDEDATKTSKKQTILKLDSQCLTFCDIKELISNLAAFTNFMTSNFNHKNPPRLITILKRITKAICSNEVRQWVASPLHYQPIFVPCSTLSYISLILQAMVAQAKNKQLHDLLKNKTLSNPTIFNNTETIYGEWHDTLWKAITHGNLGNFPETAPFHQLIKTAKPTSTPSPKQEPKATPKKRPFDSNSSSSGSPPKKQKSDIPPSELGLLVCLSLSFLFLFSFLFF